MESADLLLKVEPITHEVGHSERTGVMVEPMIKKQWFVKMRPLADHVLETQKKREEKVNFIPERYEKTMNHWMEITYDWCISRQLWWGIKFLLGTKMMKFMLAWKHQKKKDGYKTKMF